MNHLKARQRSSGRFDYTCRNNDHIWPIGYCTEWTEYTQDDAVSEEEVKRHLELKENYHTDGHATEEEAQACYKKYLLDTNLRFGTCNGTQRRCQVCAEWTERYGEVGTRMFRLCPKHESKEVIEGLFNVGESWES